MDHFLYLNPGMWTTFSACFSGLSELIFFFDVWWLRIINVAGRTDLLWQLPRGVIGRATCTCWSDQHNPVIAEQRGAVCTSKQWKACFICPWVWVFLLVQCVQPLARWPLDLALRVPRRLPSSCYSKPLWVCCRRQPVPSWTPGTNPSLGSCSLIWTLDLTTGARQ